VVIEATRSHCCRSDSDTEEKAMKKIIPAVFFQKQLNGVQEAPKKPERLELFESELREVVGGLRVNDGSGGSVTFSYSAGWADVEQADDCAA
jgi:hypothetical protein